MPPATVQYKGEDPITDPFVCLYSCSGEEFEVGFLLFRRDSPLRIILCEQWTSLSWMASPSVKSPMTVCHFSIGIWLMITVDRNSARCSMMIEMTKQQVDLYTRLGVIPPSSLQLSGNSVCPAYSGQVGPVNPEEREHTFRSLASIYSGCEYQQFRVHMEESNFILGNS